MNTPTNEKELINLFIEKIQNNSISKSPYSQSFYICENSEELNDISWGNKPEGSLRIANHWNFKTFAGDRIHCKISNTDEEVIEENIVAKWNSQLEEYEILFELTKETVEDIYNLYNFDYTIDSVKKTEDFIAKFRRTFKRAAVEKLVLANGKFVLNYKRELAVISEKIFKKIKKEEEEELLLKISKTKKMKEEFIKLLLLNEIRVYEKGSRNVKLSKDFILFRKYQILFKKHKKENDAPRGGLIGEKIVFNNKENQSLINKVLGE